MSFGIKKGTRFLDLSPQARIGLRFINNVFQNRTLLSDYSLPITFPFSPTNDKAFNFGKALQIISVEEEDENCFFYVAKNRYAKCKVILNGVKRNGYDCNIVFGVGAINVYKKKLAEIDLGGDRVFLSEGDVYAHADAVAPQFYPAVDYAFPMHYNPKFYDGNNPDWENFVNNYEAGTGYLRNTTGVKKNALVPWPFIAYVLKQGFGEEGYSVDGSFWDMLVAEQAILYNNTEVKSYESNDIHVTKTSDQTIALGTTGYYFTITFQKDSGAPDYDLGENYNTGTSEFIIPNTNPIHIKAVIIHEFGVIDPVYNELDIYPVIGGTSIGAPNLTTYPQPGSGAGPFTVTAEWDYTPLLSDVGLPITLIVQEASPVTDELTIKTGSTLEIYQVPPVVGTSNINLQNHVPDLTFADLLNRLAQLYNIVVSFDHVAKTATINFVQDYFDQAARDISKKKIPRLSEAETDNEKNRDVTPIYSLNYQFNGDDELEENNLRAYDPALFVGEYNTQPLLPAPVEGQFAYVKNQHRILRANDVPKWVPYSDAYYLQTVGDEGDAILVDLKPLFMMQNNVSLDLLICPTISQVGNSAQFNQVEQTFSPRLMYYHGMCPNSAGDDYPLASSTPYDHDFNIVGTEALTWDRFPGLISSHWQRWIDALAKKLSHYILYNFSYADFFNYKATDKIRTDDCVFLIMESDITLPGSDDEKPGEHKIKLLRINVPEPTPPPPAPLTIYIISKDDSSDGVTCDGRVVLGATGGTAPYIFNLDGLDTLDGIYDALCPGTYTGHVIDDLGAEDDIPVIIA